MKLWKLSQDTHIFANTHTHTNTHTYRHTNTSMHVFDLYLNLFEHVYWHDCMFVINRYIITWMLHQIFTYSDKVMLAAGLNNNSTPPPLYTIPSPLTVWTNWPINDFQICHLPLSIYLFGELNAAKIY